VTAADKAMSFAMTEAIRGGGWDEFLPALSVAIRERIMQIRPEQTMGMTTRGELWVWDNATGWRIHRNRGPRRPS
jgi:hypothetical protein